MTDASNPSELRGKKLIDPTGGDIGEVQEIYLDHETDRPEFALVNTGLFGRKYTFVPLTGAKVDGPRLWVEVDKGQVSDAPKIDPENEISAQQEEEVYRHYGIAHSESRTPDTGDERDVGTSPAATSQGGATSADREANASEATGHEAYVTTDNEAAARRLIDELWNKGNLSVADELVHPDVVGHDPALPEEIHNPSDLKQAVSMYRAAFPDLRFIIDDLFSAGDKVVYRWHTDGTHTGELQGLAPTGKPGSVTGINVDRFVDGKVAESWAQWDNLGLMQQLGAAPARGSRGERLGIQAQRLSVRAQETMKRLQERRQR